MPFRRPLLVVVAALGLTGSRASADGPVSDVHTFGQVLPSAPAHLDALFGAPAPASLAAVQAHLEADDRHAARWEAERVAASARWRDRDAAWMVQGVLHRDEGRHNLASAAFTKARGGGGPLAQFAAYYEAEQDLERGKYWVAAKECESYRATWPDGRHAEDCHRLMAVAYAKAGSWTKAREVAGLYDTLHTKAPISEQIELTLVLGDLERDAKGMIPRLQALAVTFDAPLTGRIAEETLAELRAAGHDSAVVPDDVMARRARAYSLRDAKQTAKAWAAYASLAEAPATPEEQEWVAREAETFGWRSRNWDFLVDYYTGTYAETATGETAWDLYKAYSRGGRHIEARDWADVARKKHAGTSHWSRKEEEIARGHMLARDYAGARKLFDVVGGQGGWTGMRGRYYAAFSGVMAGDDDKDTLQRLTRLITTDGPFAIEAQYWRGRVHARAEDHELARADWEQVVQKDPTSWYGSLARVALLPEGAAITARDGSWPSTPMPELPTVSGDSAPIFRMELPVASPVHPAARPASFAWVPWDAHAPPARASDPRPNPFTAADRSRPPRSYLAGPLFDKLGVDRFAGQFADKHATGWPDLQAAIDLARAGLYDLSGPLFSAIYEEWREAYKSGRNSRHAASRQMAIPSDQWRGLFNLTRDHHHVARFTYGMWEQIDDPELRAASLRLGYPLAHDATVWTHARKHDIDPYLVLGLMRQESTYNAIARSPVGATGAMQIMPRTGHLVADITRDVHFTAGDLEDPVLSVEYGIRYLGLLMQRFDGAYPLAIASYNGGPFNVSSWLKGTGADMPMDAFVEHIPFRETRDYVKKVSGGYATYLSLYAPEGHVLAPPPTPRGDHPDVVDF